jgi:hypothetical protein
VRVTVPLREVVVVMVDIQGVVVDTSANMNARRLLGASRRLVRGVDPEAKEVVERGVSMSNALIWDQVPVPTRFVFISFSYFRINLILFIFTAPSSWYLMVSPCPYWRRTIPLDQVQSHPNQVSATAYLGRSRGRKGYHQPRFTQLP